MSPASAFARRCVCVTGGAGFIGSHLVDALVAGGARVTVLDDLSTGFAGNLAHHGGAVRLVDGSVLDAAALAGALAGSEFVFHLAAYVSAPGSVAEPMRCHETNTTGTLRVLEACVKAGGVRRVVLASSSAVYGDGPELPKHEDMLMRPLSPYAQTKAAGEHLLRVWSECYGLDTAAVRFFNVFGPRQTAGSAYAAVIAAFADALLAGRSPRIYGDGMQTRDFVPVADAVQALLRAASAPGTLSGRVFNVGRGEETTVVDLARMMSSMAASPLPPQYLPARTGDVVRSVADIRRASAELGFVPSPSLEAGLRATMDWYRARAAR